MPRSPAKRSLRLPLVACFLLPPGIVVLVILVAFLAASGAQAPSVRNFIILVVVVALVAGAITALTIGIASARTLQRLGRLSTDAFVHRDAGLLESATSGIREVDTLRAQLLSTFGLLESTLGELEQKISQQEDMIAARSSELIAANEKLDRLASIDGLTGLANYREFDRVFTESLRTAVRQRAKLALLMVDIDHFKPFNELYGHEAGNDCLKGVASVLSTFSRRPLDVVARYGGEEFVLILYDPRDDSLDVIGEQLRSGVAGLEIANAGSPLGVLTISIGCAVAALSPDREFEAVRSTLLNGADAALRRAKVGRNAVVTAHV